MEQQENKRFTISEQSLLLLFEQLETLAPTTKNLIQQVVQQDLQPIDVENGVDKTQLATDITEEQRTDK